MKRTRIFAVIILTTVSLLVSMAIYCMRGTMYLNITTGLLLPSSDRGDQITIGINKMPLDFVLSVDIDGVADDTVIPAGKSGDIVLRHINDSAAFDLTSYYKSKRYNFGIDISPGEQSGGGMSNSFPVLHYFNRGPYKIYERYAKNTNGESKITVKILLK